MTAHERDQALARRREWSEATREMLARSVASGMRGEGKHRLSPKGFREYAYAKLIEQSRELQHKRRGTRRTVREVQAATTAQNRKAVTLAPLKFLECEL